MRELEEKILKEGTVLPGEILKVGSFLNQQIDVAFLMRMGDEVARLYRGEEITKVLTIEASGIAFAFAIAERLGVPMAFAKKHSSANVSGEVYTARVHSYTHNRDNDIVISKEYLKSEDKVLIADDFLAVGGALGGLLSIVEQAKASLVGCAIAIEKGFQGGGDKLRAKGIRVESLAIIESMSDDSLTFRA
ncbi:MAG: xanthine phosphoribosyltransferase [Clostridia bacterium]|nr:xanthine phosphoribosyltransferase [Clostridia bacterium]